MEDATKHFFFRILVNSVEGWLIGFETYINRYRSCEKCLKSKLRKEAISWRHRFLIMHLQVRPSSSWLIQKEEVGVQSGIVDQETISI